MDHLMFLIFLFESGENEIQNYYTTVIIDGGDKPVDVDTLIDGIASFFDSDYHADTDEEAISVILDCSGYAWHFIADGEPVPKCEDGFRMIRI